MALRPTRRSFVALAGRHPDEAAIRGMLGGYLHDLERDEEAVSHLEAAVHLAPRSELASVTLFHVLLAVGRETNAWAEAARFTSLGSSNEY